LCRYSYGVARANLRLHGYADDKIERLERGELDDPSIAFVRKLARCQPRPGKSDLSALREAGLSRGAIVELVFAVAAKSFKNRVATFLAVPPDAHDEAGSRNPITRLLARRTLRPVAARVRSEGDFGPLVALLDGTPCGQPLREIIDGAL